MKAAFLSMATAAALLVAGPAATEESLLDAVQSACQADLDKYCNQVTPGEGRLLYCVAAHEDKLSGQCSYALYEAAALLVELADSVATVATACESDIANLCGAVEAGDGRILSCLEANKAKASQACKDAVATVMAD
jgi:Golgi apparatus protein 1